MKNVERDNEALKEELQTFKFKSENLSIQLHEKEVKVEGLARDYQKTFDENLSLKNLVNVLRDQKDKGLSELNKMKHIHMERVNELNDDFNVKLATTENQLMDTRERKKYEEERAYSIMIAQEKVTEKWKLEHKKTVEAYETHMKSLTHENKALREKVTELRGQMLVDKENGSSNVAGKRKSQKSSGDRKASKSKERV
jgi:hypothetical protein